MDEPAWAAAPEIDQFTQVEPEEGAAPSARTSVKVLANATAIVIGITCDDADPSGIVSYSVRRDAELDDEDHVRVVLGPFLDGRSGYVFAVNPSGARFDALIDPGGDDQVEDWDAIWEAAAARGPNGWSVEIRIPIQSLSFKPGESAWDFNVERRLQRRLENVRWAWPQRQYEVTQTIRAGRLTGLPEFSLGRGLSVRPAVTAGGGSPAPDAPLDGRFHPSLDVTQRIGSNLLTSLTINTDFAADRAVRSRGRGGDWRRRVPLDALWARGRHGAEAPSSAPGCASTSRQTCRFRVTCNSTLTAIQWASTRACAGRFDRSRTCSWSTTTTSSRSSIAGSRNRIS